MVDVLVWKEIRNQELGNKEQGFNRPKNSKILHHKEARDEFLLIQLLASSL